MNKFRVVYTVFNAVQDFEVMGIQEVEEKDGLVYFLSVSKQKVFVINKDNLVLYMKQ